MEGHFNTAMINRQASKEWRKTKNTQSYLKSIIGSLILKLEGTITKFAM